MHSVFEHIVSMQVELNERTASNWLEAEFDWDAAILVECAESIDSTNWKWWKAGQTDLANLRVETVDILHFVVSKLVVESYAQSKINSIETVVEVLEATYAHPITGLNWVAYFKAISLHTLTGENAKLLQHLFGVFAKLEMDQVAIHHAYLTKNLLNHYRQARGYKDPNGDYLKLIGGREDNVVFGEIIAQLEQNLSLSQIKTQSFAQMDEVVADCRNRL